MASSSTAVEKSGDDSEERRLERRREEAERLKTDPFLMAPPPEDRLQERDRPNVLLALIVSWCVCCGCDDRKAVYLDDDEVSRDGGFAAVLAQQ